MADVVLQLRGLSKVFSGRRVVDRVSLEVERGAFVSLVGPSGSGKTTTLRLIAGFEAPSSGEILLNGEPVNERPPFERDVTTVFQHYALFPHMNVFDNVAFGLRSRGKLGSRAIRERVLDALDLVRLPGYERRTVRGLSGGEQQRVALARAFVNAPAVLLLDEPLGALDLKLRRQMGVELKGLQQRLHMTFLYVTHDQEEALSMSDRVVVLHGGRVEQSGSPTEVFESPRTRFVADFIGESNILPGVLLGLEAAFARVELNGFTCVAARPPAPPAVGAAVTLSLRGEKVALNEEAAARRNQLRGSIEQALFYGASSELIVLLENGQRLRVRKPRPGAPQGCRNGEAVLVGWDPHDAVVVAED